MDGTAAVWDNHGITGLDSPFIAVVRPNGFARTYDCGSDSPDFLDTGDPTPSLPVPRLRRCLRVLDFAKDIDPGPDLSGREAVSASDEPSGALALPGEPLPAAPCYVDIFCRGVSPQPLLFRDFMQKTAHVSPAGPVREDSGYVSSNVGGVGPLRSWRATESHLFGLPVSSRLVVWESPLSAVPGGMGLYICAEVGDAISLNSDLVTELHLFVLHICRGLVLWASTALPVRENCGYINAGVGGVRPLRSCRLTESYLFVSAVRVELVLWELHRLLELLLWTDFSCLCIFRTQWWRFIMSSGMGSPTTERAVRTPAVLEPLPGIFRGFNLTLQSDRLYDLDREIAGVIGLRYSLLRLWLRSCQSRIIDVVGLSFRITMLALMVSTRFSFMIWRTLTPLMCQSVSWGVFD